LLSVSTLDKYTNKHSRFVKINRMMVHYRIEGEGFPLLLLHGTFSSLHTYNGWTKILSKQFKVIRLDLPGFGLTGPSKTANYSINAYMRFLNKFLNTLEIDQLHIAGSSLGGWLAWEYALLNPKKVKKLILIGAAGYFIDQKLPLPFLLAKMPVVSNFVKHITPRSMVEKFIKEVFSDQSKVTEEVVDRYHAMVTYRGNMEAFIKLANTRYELHGDRVMNIKTPTLIMWGADDKWVTIKNAYAFDKNLVKSKLLIYDGVGHIPMEEIPQVSAKDAKTFLLNGKAT